MSLRSRESREKVERERLREREREDLVSEKVAEITLLVSDFFIRLISSSMFNGQIDLGLIFLAKDNSS